MAPDELVQRVAAALAAVEEVRVAWVFGSRVTGGAGPRSDLDVAVAFAPTLPEAAREAARRRIVAAMTDALGALGERTDVVDVERAASAVAFRALRDGRRALSRSERERIAVETRIVRRHDDDAPRRELYRRAARAHALGTGGHDRP
jgi:predicted nucleotidyltransferase